MNLTVLIESAELQFRQVLEDYFISVYGDKHLSSHGIDHHRRVWNYSKELISLPSYINKLTDNRFPVKLIIACYMHDVGMSVETGSRHGMHSKELCENFFRLNHLPESNFPDVLEAIESHDIKEYAGDKSVNDILDILSVADDLDAYGFTGIYRYSEIYLTREINPAKIGHLIKENAARRFGNFKLKYESSGEFFIKHKIRYEILDDFFTGYNNQIGIYKFGSGLPHGYPGIIELFLEIIKDNKGLKEISDKPENFSYDQVMTWYFKGLNSELF